MMLTCMVCACLMLFRLCLSCILRRKPFVRPSRVGSVVGPVGQETKLHHQHPPGLVTCEACYCLVVRSASELSTGRWSQLLPPVDWTTSTSLLCRLGWSKNVGGTAVYTLVFEIGGTCCSLHDKLFPELVVGRTFRVFLIYYELS